MFQIFRKNILHVSLNYPKIVIFLFLLLSAFIISGIKYIVQDDDMVRLLPDDIPSIIAFSDITDEFGNYEFMYIGIGHKNKSAINSELLDIVWEISSEIEQLNQCE